MQLIVTNVPQCFRSFSEVSSEGAMRFLVFRYSSTAFRASLTRNFPSSLLSWNDNCLFSFLVNDGGIFRRSLVGLELY